MKFFNKIAGATLLLFTMFSCDLNKSQTDIASHNVIFSVNGVQGNIKVLPSNSGQLFASVSSDADWKIKIEDKNANPVSWLSVDNNQGGKTDGFSIIISYKENTDVERSAFIILSNSFKSDTIRVSQQGVKPSTGGDNGNTGGGDNGNTGGSGNTPIAPPAPSGEIIKGDVTLLETPKLAGGSNNWYVTFYVNGKPNYSLEWDSNWKIPRWVCFSFDRETRVKRVGRTNAWAWDGIIEPAESIISKDYFGHYDRGHMVASNDRTYSREANMQTFYYVNMTPQLSGLNQEFWATMENWVQDRARSNFLGDNDVMYVTKGVAFNGGNPSKWTSMSLAVPDYYYMALVVKKDGKYHGMGMWVEHKPIDRKERTISQVALTIDEIEKRAGVDLFPNLPDDIENMVEKEEPHSGFWPGV